MISAQQRAACLREMAERVATGLTEPQTLTNIKKLAHDAFALHEEAESISHEALALGNSCGVDRARRAE